MLRVAVVALGGALGAVARYGVSLLVARLWTFDFPLGTFLINVTGSFILGFFATFAAERTALDPLWRLLVATGFVGAYTTFSTFEYETQRLTESGATSIAVANVIASVIAGFAAVQLGILLARR
ncbi:MAG TPA: fluoride efflux transporter CrcB [Thermoanaerobaculia bacterium]|nr:fluoride efflux transporter CrcB [Thermoanaerobaculia bacterium]